MISCCAAFNIILRSVVLSGSIIFHPQVFPQLSGNVWKNEDTVRREDSSRDPGHCQGQDEARLCWSGIHQSWQFSRVSRRCSQIIELSVKFHSSPIARIFISESKQFDMDETESKRNENQSPTTDTNSSSSVVEQNKEAKKEDVKLKKFLDESVEKSMLQFIMKKDESI